MPPWFSGRPGTRAEGRYRALAVCGLLLAAVAIVFGQTVGHGFINLDDNQCVYDNHVVQQGLTWETVKWAFTTHQLGNWAPLCWLSHALDCQIYGAGRPGGHHLTNLLLHALTVVVLFLVLQKMTGRPGASALVAALFAIHPLRAESVAWVAERKDVLSGLCFVLTLAAYAGYAQQRRFSLLRYLLVLALFALGLMTKPMLVTLPLVLLMLDFWPLGRLTATKPRSPIAFSRAIADRGFPARSPIALSPARSPIAALCEKVPLLALSAAACAVTFWAEDEALLPPEFFQPSWRIGTATRVLRVLPGKVLLSRGSGDLPASGLRSLGGANLFAPAVLESRRRVLILAAVTAAALVWRHNRPYVLVGWLWFLAMLLPVIGLVQFGIQTVADRFTYLPQIGLWIALVWTAADAGRGPLAEALGAVSRSRPC